MLVGDVEAAVVPIVQIRVHLLPPVGWQAVRKQLVDPRLQRPGAKHFGPRLIRLGEPGFAEQFDIGQVVTELAITLWGEEY